MTASTVRVMRAALAGLTALTVVASGGTRTAAQLPGEPVKESGLSVTGAFEGWYPNADGSYSVLVGYFNRNTKQTFDIPIGPDNRIEPGGPDRGQPTHFLPRRQWGVFTITVPRDFGTNKLTWTLVANGQTTVIPLHLDLLWLVEPLKDAALGNTPPVIRLDPAGAAQQGPPNGTSASFVASVARALDLPVWVTDDGIRAPEAARRPAAVATIAWSKFRGPGHVTFDPPMPARDEKTGHASTTATFSAPGEYILRVQANDATGDGGGGFQCCWTNAHVKVTVK